MEPNPGDAVHAGNEKTTEFHFKDNIVSQLGAVIAGRDAVNGCTALPVGLSVTGTDECKQTFPISSCVSK